MALVGTNRGAGGNTNTGTSITLNPGSNFTAGSMAILCIFYDNSDTAGADPWTNINDSVGNTWTPRINRLNDPGNTNAGTALRIFTSLVTTLTTADNIVVFFNSLTVPKAYTLTEVTAGANLVPTYVTGASAIATTASPTITSSSIPTNDLILGVAGGEQNGTRTGDTDTTNGTWSTQQQIGFGSTTSGQEITSQFKVVTAAGTQTYNPTFSASADRCIGWIQITEAAAPVATSFDPMGMMGFFGM